MKGKPETHLTFDLRPHQEELLHLSELAGIRSDPTVFKIIIELLNMQVPPHIIFSLLKNIRRSNRNKKPRGNQMYSSASS